MLIAAFLGSFAACFLSLSLLLEIQDEKRSHLAIRRVLGF